MTQPASVTADGNVKTLWVPAITAPTAPTVSELTAVSVVDLSLYLTGDGMNPSAEEAAVVDERMASRRVYEQPGRVTEGLEIAYVYRQQDPAATDNKAFSTLTRLATGFLVIRWGKAFDTAIAAADKVDVYPAKCGKQRKGPPTANGILRITQRIFVTGEVQENVSVAA